MRRHRSGFTLVEVLAVLAVIGVLVALLIPAVQAAREAARRAQCANNLRQIGIAVNAYAAAVGVLPRGEKGYSPHVMILPYMDQVPAYNAINFAKHSAMMGMENVTAGIRIDTFLCPSDTPPDDSGPANSYAANYGYGFDANGAHTNGPFSTVVLHSIRGASVTQGPGFAQITDGADSTAAFSEWCLTPFDKAVRDAKRSVFEIGPYLDFNTFVDHCDRLVNQDRIAAFVWKGASWLEYARGSTLYNHNCVINAHTCINPSSTQLAAWTAGSFHPGGALTLMLSGRVRFVRDSVSLRLWRAIGTMNGGEVVDGSWEQGYRTMKC